MKPYIVCGMILYNEEKLIPYSFGSLYNHVDKFVIVDHMSTDKTVAKIKELDPDNKAVIISRKWDNSYKNARNTYLDYIKKNIYPKNKFNTYYLRVDADEVYEETWLDKVRAAIDENPDAEGFRSNFYTFTADYAHLDEVNPTESRVSLFRYTPDLVYANDLHEMPIHGNTGIPFYGHPLDDKRLGIVSIPGYAYLHFTWCDVDRCVVKAKNYTEHYVKQGTETKERLDTITASKDSWWWDKKSSIRYTGKWPSIIKKLGFLEGQTDNEVTDGTKISVYTIIKNGIKFDYPFVEAINSILPIADEVIVNCGDSEDGTEGLLHKAFDGISKVKIFKRTWEGKDSGNVFLKNQSNWAKEQCRNNICLYLQSDEVYHEEDLEKLLKAAKELEDSPGFMGALFQWRHFDGIPTHINKDSYPQEVRLIKKNALDSIGDAQSMGVRVAGLRNVMAFSDALLKTDVRVFHYGWLREPKKMLAKLRDFDRYYHTEQEWKEMHKDDEKRHLDGSYNYGDKIDNFEETHPSIMYPRIRRYEKLNNLGEKARFNQ